MPEKGGYSLTVRKETVVRVRELAKNNGLTVDEFINELMRPSSKCVWSTCTVCGACARSWKFSETHGQGATEDCRVMKCDLTGQLRYKLARARAIALRYMGGNKQIEIKNS